MPCSQGQRSSSVSGTPACIFSTLDGGWNQSPSSKIQFSRWASIAAIVLLSQPETPITTTTEGLPAGEAGLFSDFEPGAWRGRRDADRRRRRGAAADVRFLRRLIMSVRPVVARDRKGKVSATQQGEHSADATGVNGSILRKRASLDYQPRPGLRRQPSETSRVGGCADLTLGAVEEPRDVGAMHDPQQQRQQREQHRRRPIPHEPQRKWRRRAGNERGKRGVARERGDDEPDEAEGDRHRPCQRQQEADIGGNALAALEAEPKREEVAEK